MDKFDYSKAVEELEQLAQKIEDPSTGIEAADEMVRQSRKLIELCRDFLRSVRDAVEDGGNL